MRSPRLLITALALTAALTACSGDDSSDDAPSEEPSSATETRGPLTETEERADCAVDVKITGKFRKSWTGDGSVITQNQSGPVQYTASKGKVQITVLGAEGDFDALATVRKGDKSFTTQGGTVEVDGEGGGAQIDASASSSAAGRGIELVASFEC